VAEGPRGHARYLPTRSVARLGLSHQREKYPPWVHNLAMQPVRGWKEKSHSHSIQNHHCQRRHPLAPQVRCNVPFLSFDDLALVPWHHISILKAREAHIPECRKAACRINVEPVRSAKPTQFSGEKHLRLYLFPLPPPSAPNTSVPSAVSYGYTRIIFPFWLKWS